MAQLMGESVPRTEDERFLTGRGAYVANMLPEGSVFAKFVRSTYAHARILHIDTARAAALPGVLGVFTAADLKGESGSIFTAWLIPNSNLKTPPYSALAKDVVRYAGEAVAVVVAEDPYVAEDARELVEVTYDPLPVVVVFKEAGVLMSQRFVSQRLQPSAMEPRAAIAQYEPGTKGLTLHVTSQNPHVHRLPPPLVPPGPGPE